MLRCDLNSSILCPAIRVEYEGLELEGVCSSGPNEWTLERCSIQCCNLNYVIKGIMIYS